MRAVKGWETRRELELKAKEARKEEERKKEYVGLPHWHKRYEELSGMSKIIDLEHKAEEARKEEERVKEKLRREREEILNDMRKLIAELIEDENDAATTYKTLSEHARGLDLQNIERQFVELSRDEERHRIILRDIQSILSRTR
jgi:rubrerythrin